jgi:hypothetical protein
VAASALAWVCLLKSGSAGVAGAERSHMLFSAECRSRLAPPLPAEYFGNCLRPCFVEAATADLLSGETADGVATAASAIGSAIREMEQGVLEGAEGWLGRVLSVLPERPMSVGGSPRHGVYETTDFGWGRPARVEMVSVEKTPGTRWRTAPRVMVAWSSGSCCRPTPWTLSLLALPTHSALLMRGESTFFSNTKSRLHPRIV